MVTRDFRVSTERIRTSPECQYFSLGFRKYSGSEAWLLGDRRNKPPAFTGSTHGIVAIRNPCTVRAAGTEPRGFPV
jgi:hypothetical protein